MKNGADAPVATMSDNSNEHRMAALTRANPPKPDDGETSNSESYLIRLSEWDRQTQIPVAPFDSKPYPQIFDPIREPKKIDASELVRICSALGNPEFAEFQKLMDGLPSAAYQGVQPIWRFRPGMGNSRCGAEALIRLLSNTGHDAPLTIGKWLMNHQVRYYWNEFQILNAAEVLTRDPTLEYMSINVYPEDYIMHTDKLVEWWKRTGSVKDRIVFEVTEYQADEEQGAINPREGDFLSEAARQGYNMPDPCERGLPGNAQMFNPSDANMDLLFEAVKRLSEQGMKIAIDDIVDEKYWGKAKQWSTFARVQRFLPYVFGAKLDIMYLSGLFFKLPVDGIKANKKAFETGKAFHPGLFGGKFHEYSPEAKAAGMQQPLILKGDVRPDDLQDARNRMREFMDQCAALATDSDTTFCHVVFEYTATKGNNTEAFPHMCLENVDDDAESLGAHAVMNGLYKGMEVQMQGGNTSKWAQNYVDGTPKMIGAPSKRERLAKQMKQLILQRTTPDEERKQCDSKLAEKSRSLIALDLECAPVASKWPPVLLGRAKSGG